MQDYYSSNSINSLSLSNLALRKREKTKALNYWHK